MEELEIIIDDKKENAQITFDGFGMASENADEKREKLGKYAKYIFECKKYMSKN